VVSGHLAVAVLLFVTLLTFSLRAETHAELEDADATPANAPPSAHGLTAAFAIVAVLTYTQVVLGGLVSTNHAATVCPDWPTCRGEWFPPMTGLVGIHMLHRFGGYLVALAVLLVALAARTESLPVRAGARIALTLVVAQVVLGVCNVLLAAPVWISAMHLAAAVALLATLVITTYRLAAAPAANPALVPAEVR
jgi:heme A synthase